ncbi:M14 family zinc carboxypeptidase [Nocardioides pakistanensis]
MTGRAAVGAVAAFAAVTAGADALPQQTSAADATTTVAAATSAPRRPAVVEQRVIGRSVKGRPIRAWRLGEPRSRVKVVALASLHGDEAHPRMILDQLRDGRPVRGIDLWVVPAANPDGLRGRQRKNANGVDLNRNFPRAWVPQDGQTESGSGPASEPETRALMRFLRRVDPRFVVSFHQPLHGVDTWRAKRPRFVRRLAEHLRLPRKEFPCGGTCHGTFTQWFNHHFDGAAVTVEYGARPSWEHMNRRAPRQLLRALGGTR